MISFDQFKQEWLGRIVDFDHVFKYQCVDLVLQYVYECYDINGGVSGNAIDYWTKTGVNGFNQALLNKFTKLGTNEAQKGDIVVFNGLPGNPSGHIGVATGNINASEIEILEQNGATGSGNGTGGDVIRVRYVARSRVAGLLRPVEVAAAPAPVHPYTIEDIPSKQVKFNKATHRWGLNYDNFTAIDNNPEGNVDPSHDPITVVAILHHNIGYKYYLEDRNVAAGYNVLDCDDYTPPRPDPVKSAPPAGPLTAPNTEPYEVVKTIRGYATSNQAINHVDDKVDIPEGTYFIFNKRFTEGVTGLIALNITKTPGTPGAWINPLDNVPDPDPTEAEIAAAAEEAAQRDAEQAAADEAEKRAAELAAAQPSFADTYKPLPAAQLYVAMKDLSCVDLEGKRKNADMPQYGVTWIVGTFTVNGVDYARPKSAADRDWWFGIEWTDPETHLANLELESEVFKTETTLEDRQATKTLRLGDKLTLAYRHGKQLVLGFIQLLSKIKSAKATK